MKCSGDFTPPYRAGIEEACMKWLVELTASIYEQHCPGELRYSKSGHRTLRTQFFTEGASAAVASQDWALAGRRSVAVAMLILTRGPLATFPEHQTTQAARCLVNHPLDKGPMHLTLFGDEHEVVGTLGLTAESLR